jgi:hypothetical protein
VVDLSRLFAVDLAARSDGTPFGNEGQAREEDGGDQGGLKQRTDRERLEVSLIRLLYLRADLAEIDPAAALSVNLSIAFVTEAIVELDAKQTAATPSPTATKNLFRRIA